MTPQEAMKLCREKQDSRNHEPGQQPYYDEVLLAHIEHLELFIADSGEELEALVKRLEALG